MARKSQRRSRPRSLTTLETPTTVEDAPVREAPTKLGRTIEQEYAHIRGDLTRILILATSIFAGMLVLKFVVGIG